MESGANISVFVLSGLVEMEGLRCLYCALSTVIYSLIMTLSISIILVVLTERSLQEPMYILISNLVLNGVFGTSSFFPKLIVDLITSTETISRNACLAQSTAMALFAVYDLSTFSIMAYDRYLAVCHPLHYVTLMTNEKVLKLIIGSWVISFLGTLIAILLTRSLPLCGDKLNNIFCDNMSLVALSCVDSSTTRLYTAMGMTIYFIITFLVTGFSYVKIFITCSKLSKESRHKAFHTLLTHLINFSIFVVGVFFVFIRYRLGEVKLSLTVHVLLSIIPIVIPPLFNPLIYGVRTQALKIKLLKHFGKLHVETKSLRHSLLQMILNCKEGLHR
ncbi:olfactory receptor 4C12-like [Hyperolius riggenbachi]|uniref:olfactory receptor 4C12-like n=1 Tax=Hyperolius riggenbachi TaxID=752182 RepID=UPI0035A38B29